MYSLKRYGACAEIKWKKHIGRPCGFKDNGPEHYSNLKVLPHADYAPSVSMDSALDFVRIQLIGASQIVIIESLDFAQSFRQVFELAWKNFGDAKTVAEAYFDTKKK